MTGSEHGPELHDVPGFDRAVGSMTRYRMQNMVIRESDRNGVLPMAGIRLSTSFTVRSSRRSTSYSNSRRSFQSRCRFPTRFVNWIRLQTRTLELDPVLETVPDSRVGSFGR